MLEDFAWAGDRARELVIDNPNKIADSVMDNIPPIPPGTFQPHIDGANEELTEKCWNMAKELYGDPVPEYVAQRLQRELDSIIGHGADNKPIPFLSKHTFGNKRACFKGFYIGMRNHLIQIFSAVFAFFLRNGFIKRCILLNKKNNVMTLILICFHIHKIGIFFVINQISLHTKNKLNLSLGSIISLR